LWFHDWDVATGSGVDYLTINPFLGSIDEQAHFAITLGGLGGGGGQGVAAEGGDGGEGGAAGDVDIQGTSNAAAGTDNDYVYGWNGDNGGTLSLNASPSVIGDLAIYLDDAGAEQLRVCAVGGSGGGPGGTISGHPGWFGDAGTDGTVAVVLTP
jgi:hypothetical protein